MNNNLLKTLLSPQQCKVFAPIAFNMSVDKIAAVLPTVEYDCFAKVVGMGFYEVLKGDLADYSGVPVWTAGTYNNGDQVSCQGAYYEANTTTSQTPDNAATDWNLLGLFNEDAYNVLWCNFLGAYISLTAVNASLPYTFSQLRDAGLTDKIGRAHV